MSRFDEMLSRLGELLAELEALEGPARERVFELLDGIDRMHRIALGRLPSVLGPEGVERLRAGDPALCWLLDAYGVGVGERTAADRALEQIRPCIQSHGGEVEFLSVRDGVVRLRVSGSCLGSTGSAIALREGVEKALRDSFPGFVALELEEGAVPQPPPGATPLQLEDRPR